MDDSAASSFAFSAASSASTAASGVANVCWSAAAEASGNATSSGNANRTASRPSSAFIPNSNSWGSSLCRLHACCSWPSPSDAAAATAAAAATTAATAAAAPLPPWTYALESRPPAPAPDMELRLEAPRELSICAWRPEALAPPKALPPDRLRRRTRSAPDVTPRLHLRPAASKDAPPPRPGASAPDRRHPRATTAGSCPTVLLTWPGFLLDFHCELPAPPARGPLARRADPGRC